MDGLSLLAEARAHGLKVRADGDRLVIRGPRQAEAVAKRLLERKREILEALRVSISGELVARVQAAWPWIAEHRPDLYRTICDADYAGDADRLRAAMEEASKAWANRSAGDSTRIFSKVLGAELWIAPDEEAAEQLRRDGETLPILLPSEAMILGRMAEADARDLFAVLAKVQAIMPGSRLRGFDEDGDA